LISSFLTYSS